MLLHNVDKDVMSSLILRNKSLIWIFHWNWNQSTNENACFIWSENKNNDLFTLYSGLWGVLVTITTVCFKTNVRKRYSIQHTDLNQDFLSIKLWKDIECFHDSVIHLWVTHQFYTVTMTAMVVMSSKSANVHVSLSMENCVSNFQDYSGQIWHILRSTLNHN